MARRRRTRKVSRRRGFRRQRRRMTRRQRGGFGWDSIGLGGVFGQGSTNDCTVQTGTDGDYVEKCCKNSWYNIGSGKYKTDPVCTAAIGRIRQTNPSFGT